MSKDYYKILGVSRGSTKDEIKKAYRKLAHQYHPDKKGGDESKFKEVNEAYTILSDDTKRSQYDQFGQTFSGNTGQGGAGFGGFSNFDFSQFTNANGANFEFDLNDILGSVFGGRARAARGKDISIDVEIDFKDSVLGISKEVKINRQGGETEKIMVNIPPGIDSGEMLRYKSKGEPLENGSPGDLYIKIHVKSHPKIKKEGAHLIIEENIKFTESLTGVKKKIETIDGEMTIKIPKGVKNGEFLRVKEKGVPITPTRSGDLLIKVNIETPKKLSQKAEEALKILKEEGL